MIAFFFDPIARLLGASQLSAWLTADAVMRNSLFVVLFMLLTIYIISAGVKEGIEKWASRLMPSLIVILLLLIVYVLTLPALGWTSCLSHSGFFSDSRPVAAC